jgi:hypothetical protein
MRDEGLGFEVWGLKFRVQGSGLMVQGSGFRVQGAGCAPCSQCSVLRYMDSTHGGGDKEVRGVWNLVAGVALPSAGVQAGQDILKGPVKR